MPMYGVVFSFKDPFDTRDMRTTAGGDARYDIDVPARDHVLVEQLRNKGAIIFAKAVNTEYNGRAGDPGGRHAPDQVLPSTLGIIRCVRREVKEEVGVDVDDIQYVGSQNWPFPSQLMVGFVARYAGGEVKVDPEELEDARWFPKGQLPSRPSHHSIAGFILKNYGE